jgi:hypothetical protein
MDELEKKPVSKDRELSVTGDAQPEQIKKRFNFWTAVGISVCTSGAVSIPTLNMLAFLLF